MPLAAVQQERFRQFVYTLVVIGGTFLPKQLQISYKVDLVFWDCFLREKNCITADLLRTVLDVSGLSGSGKAPSCFSTILMKLKTFLISCLLLWIMEPTLKESNS